MIIELCFYFFLLKIYWKKRIYIYFNSMAFDMETSLAKKYASILEILILISIAFYIINKAIINNL